MSSKTTIIDTTDNSVTSLAAGAIKSDGTGNKIGTSDIILGDGAMITSTDHGAIKDALGFSTDTAKGAFSVSMQAIDQISGLAKSQTAAGVQNSQVLADLAESIKTDGASRAQTTMQIVAVVALVVVVGGGALWAWGGK